MSDSLVILGVTVDSKLKFEEHLRGIVSSAARAVGIMRMAGKIFEIS